MKVLKNILIVVGLLVVAGAGALLVKNIWDLRVLYEIAMANKSQASVVNPTNMVLVGAGLAAIGGLFLGLGIGIPRRTSSRVGEDAVDTYKKNLLDTGSRGAAPEARDAELKNAPRDPA